ncbi:hypothetical protein V6N12_025166 [Hibiscus sabdariffa]|uniref:Wall-associated receptor kinase galacturonan-binding domain-containing protein n=1 Tax=Hibiscus sabdariffa TaxID=183260 RepID=A0ABR2BMC5_9ROSI
MSPLPAASLFLSILFFLPRLDKVSAAGRTIPTRVICNNTCGTIPVGTGFGCGHPYFARYIKCNAGTLQFSNGTGIYIVPISLSCSVAPHLTCLIQARICARPHLVLVFVVVLYSCKGVNGVGLPQNAPTSTCCVYDALMGIGSGYSLDLPKFQCSSYTSIFEFGDEGDPMKWKFGTSLLYNDSYYTPAGKDCETSGGLCGFTGLDWMDHFPAFVGMV